MSLTEILAEIPRLSFAERQELVRRTIELEDEEITPEEKAILDERLSDFRGRFSQHSTLDSQPLS